jgi:hypothetical protein
LATLVLTFSDDRANMGEPARRPVRAAPWDGTEPKGHSMAKSRVNGPNEIAELLKDLLITQLGAAGVRQQAIRQVVGCSMTRVNRIVRHLKLIRKKEPD